MPPKRKPTKVDQFLTQQGLRPETGLNFTFDRLKDKPTPDHPTRDNEPQTQVPTRNAIHQIDILYLRHDSTGNKYALVVVDLATSHMDAEPLKKRDASSAKKALQNIYRRKKYLQIPGRIEVDGGGEFKGVFRSHFEPLMRDRHTPWRVKEPYRHRQQSMVESKNLWINRYLKAMQDNNRALTGNEDSEWVEKLPAEIKRLNEAHTHEPKVVDAIKEPPRCKGRSCNLLDEGTKVRVVLEAPEDYVTRRKEGDTKWRDGDERWDRTVRKIEVVVLRPAQPPMYIVTGKPQVGYTRNQLQVVGENEVQPTKATPDARWTINRLIDRKKEKGVVLFLTEYKGHKPVWIKRSVLMLSKDGSALVSQYEKKQTKKQALTKI